MAGKNAALFKPFLFADQELDALIANMVPPPGVLAEARNHLLAGAPEEVEVVIMAEMISRPSEISAWHRIVLAMAQSQRGDKDAALRTLRAVADEATDSRVRLWTWQALRRWSDTAPPELTHRVEGAIVEVEIGRGVETLAAYADGTARYVLTTGSRFIWDAPDGRLAGPIAAVLDGGRAVFPLTSAGRLPGEPSSGRARMTLLTSLGPYSIERTLIEVSSDTSPLAPLFGPATDLLQRIVRLANW